LFEAAEAKGFNLLELKKFALKLVGLYQAADSEEVRSIWEYLCPYIRCIPYAYSKDSGSNISINSLSMCKFH